MSFAGACIPHLNQSAYCKRVSCADATFATQETIARYMRCGSHVFMCLYDLEKAFDSVEYPILLDRLYAAGINGKCWRLIRNWYEGARCRVKIQEGKLSQPFVVERGVKQGSILSPALFLLIMDPLLISLQQSGIGLSVNDFFAGGFLHADDIRTLSTSIASLEAQVSFVLDFASNNFLNLNIQKCEISFHSAVTPPASVMFLVLLMGYLWCPQQSAWGIGGRGTFLHPSQFMRIPRKPEGHSLAMAVLGPFKET